MTHAIGSMIEKPIRTKMIPAREPTDESASEPGGVKFKWNLAD